jgi:glutamate-1-semialdehyde aminotransferase
MKHAMTSLAVTPELCCILLLFLSLSVNNYPFITRSIFAKIDVVQGNGCELTSLDGDVYVDFLGEFTAGIYGHSNELIANAVTEAMKKGWNYGGPNPHERELASKVEYPFFLIHS